MEYYPEEVWINWLDQLSDQNYVEIESFLPTEIYDSIASFLHQKLAEEAFERAQIGPNTKAQVISEIRGDYTYWLSRSTDAELSSTFEFFEDVRQKLNRYCYLSLSDYEFHLAHYPAGSFYKAHYDQFKERSNRLISMIIYFNEEWQTGDGGELKIFQSEGKEIIINPTKNKMVMFKSADILHEVLITNKPRLSLTGWFLYQPAGLGYLFG